MKKTKLLVAVLAIALFIPASSYALVDFGVYGGYSYANIDTEVYQEDMNGWEWGMLGHVNTGLPMLFSVGLGAFYQRTNADFEIGNTTVDADRVMWGIDVMATLELPIFIHPYLRMGIAIKEELEIDQGNNTTTVTNEKYFNSHYYGIGAQFSVFPMVRVFGEYVFNYSNQENDTVVKSNAIHVGAMLSI